MEGRGRDKKKEGGKEKGNERQLGRGCCGVQKILTIDPYMSDYISLHELRTYDNIRQGDDRLGLHPSW